MAAFAVACAASSIAMADEKKVCADAYKDAQTLRDDHKLVKARDQLRICGRAECPGFIAKECADWLKDVEARLPSIVLSAKNAAGSDLTDVRVTMDGDVVATKLDGLAIYVDPGQHAFVFETPDGKADQRLIVPEGAKALRVAVTLGSASTAAPAAPDKPSEAPASAPPAAEIATTGVTRGLSFGLRLGYALPAGAINGVSGNTLKSAVNGMVPIQIDVGFLAHPVVLVGAYVSYGIVQAADTAFLGDCGVSGVSCSGSVIRTGIQVQVRPLGTSKLQPWIGVGFGYEQLAGSASGFGMTENATYHAVELVNPQVGFDYKFIPQLSAGVFAGASISMYLSGSGGVNGASDALDLGDHALHEWIYFGARASFDLQL